MPYPKGLRYRFARAAFSGILILISALPAAAQSAWTRNTALKKFTVDDTWGTGWSRSGSRLACDKQNTVFIALGDSLLMGESHGRSWKTANLAAAHSFGSHPALAVGANGSIMWGNTVSPDHGSTWAARTGSQSAYITSAAVTANGNLLAGGSYDHIDMSPDLGKTWSTVHTGKTFGNIVDMVCAPDGWAVAAPYSDVLLASRDNGKTWATVDSLTGSGPYVQTQAQVLAYGTGTNSVWGFSRPFNTKGSLVEIGRYAAAITKVTHEVGAGFPDSAITALQVTPPSYPLGQTILVASWGQGVFSSIDLGKTWTARNAGLADLHVEALVVSDDGVVHALTKDGFFSLGSGTGIRTGAAMRHSMGPGTTRASTLLFGNGSEVSNPVGNLFRADGRAARIPSTDQRPIVGAP